MRCSIDAQVLRARGFQGEQDDVLWRFDHGRHGSIGGRDKIVHVLLLEVADDAGFLVGEVVEEIGADELAVRVSSCSALPCIGVSGPEVGSAPEDPEDGSEGEAACDGSWKVAAAQGAVGEDDEQRSGEGSGDEFGVEVFRGGGGDVADVLHHGEDA